MADEELAWFMEDAPPPGLSTGIGELDDALGRGLHPGRLLLIGARPSIGKSVLAGQIAAMAGARRANSLLFSLEMSRREYFARALARRCAVPYSSILDRRMTQVERERVTKLAPEVADYSVTVDVESRSMVQIRAACERHAQVAPLELVVVDYLQLVKPSRTSRDSNRAAEVTEVAEALKDIAVVFDCPVVAAVQLNRGPETRHDKAPALSDMRESGGLEATADSVVLIHRPDFYDPKERPGEADLILAKHRHGAQTSITVNHQLAYARFIDRNLAF
jgi:replicative DNA helicase